jgi:hypothetical protein
MSGCQKTTLLVLLCAVLVVFWALFQVLQVAIEPPASTPSPWVLHTPTSTSTATPTPLAAETSAPIPSPTPEKTLTATPTRNPPRTPSSTPAAATSTPTASPTSTATHVPSPTPAPQPTVPAEVADYLDQFVPLVTSVDGERILSPSTRIDMVLVDQLRDIYRRLHDMKVPAEAEEMQLDFIVYVSMLEEKCLCHIFADAHSTDAQGEHFRECESRATQMATGILRDNFVAARDGFLRSYSLTAPDVGFPH